MFELMVIIRIPRVFSLICLTHQCNERKQLHSKNDENNGALFARTVRRYKQ